ncbi:hypothetical protein LIER_27378 [Lithospermum erythrorhizon]|uniref:Uncharacterized protein n=1 Tax=Lithospermum erythrorhizon TaxID=34254 RepID=A0AAV3RDH5_LITER
MAASSTRRPQQAKSVRANIDHCGSELSERDLASIRARAEERLCRGLRESPTSPCPSFRGSRVVSSKGLSNVAHPQHVDLHQRLLLCCLLAGVTPMTEFFLTSFSQHRRMTFSTSWEGLSIDIPARFMPHRKSTGALLMSTKHKADSVAFAPYWENTRPMPLHFYSDPRVLKVDGLALGSVSDLGALEALRATYNVGDHAPLPLPIAPCPRQRRAGDGEQLIKRGRGDGSPHEKLPAPLAAGSSVSKKSSTNPSHEELIYSLLTLEDKFFNLQGVALCSYRRLLATYEVASGSSSRINQLEQELRTLRKAKAREERRALRHHLKNLSGEHDTLKERYAASVRRTDSVKAELDGVRTERDFAEMEREAFWKERKVLRTSRD